MKRCIFIGHFSRKCLKGSQYGVKCTLLRRYFCRMKNLYAEA